MVLLLHHKTLHPSNISPFSSARLDLQRIDLAAAYHRSLAPPPPGPRQTPSSSSPSRPSSPLSLSGTSFSRPRDANPGAPVEMMRAEIEGVPYHTIHHRGGIPAGEGMEGRIETAAAARGGAGGGHGVLPPPSRTNEHVHNRRGISLATVVPPARGTTTTSSPFVDGASGGGGDPDKDREGTRTYRPAVVREIEPSRDLAPARRPVLDIAGAGRKVGGSALPPPPGCTRARRACAGQAGGSSGRLRFAVRRDDVPRLPAPCRSVDDQMGGGPRFGVEIYIS